MVTPPELETFQTCPALWKLSKQDGCFASQVEDDYTTALKRTLYRMYAWRMSNNKPMRYESVREHWDKNWWASKLDDGEQEQAGLMELAAKGWMWLEKYWGEIYVEETDLFPISVNFEFSFYRHELHHRVHVDVLLSDNEQRMTYIEFGERKSSWSIFTSLATKAEVTALTHGLTVPPIRKLHYNLREQNPTQKPLNISPAYLRHAQGAIDNISKMIRDETIIASPSQHCHNCPYKGKCWF